MLVFTWLDHWNIHMIQFQQYVDLHIVCEDGALRAHQMMLAVASPFLKQLLHSPGDAEPCVLVLPEVRIIFLLNIFMSIKFLYLISIVFR